MDIVNIPDHTKRLAGFLMRKFPNYRVGIKDENTFYLSSSFFHALRFKYEPSFAAFSIHSVIGVLHVVWAILAFFYIIFCAYVYFEFESMSHSGWSNISLVISFVVGAALLYFTVSPVWKANRSILYTFNKEYPYSDAQTDIDYFDTHIMLHEKSKKYGMIYMSIFLGTALLLYLFNFNGIQNLFFGSPYHEAYHINSYEEKYECYLDSVSGKYGTLKITYGYPSDMDYWERGQVYYSSYALDERVSKSIDTITAPILGESVYFYGDLGWYEEGDTHRLINYKGEEIFSVEDNHIFYQLDQVMPDLYVVELGNKWQPHEVFVINSNGERIISGPIDSRSYAISDEEFWSGNFIYSINGERRLSEEGWIRISLCLSVIILVIVFELLRRNLKVKIKKGEVLEKWFLPVWQLHSKPMR